MMPTGSELPPKPVQEDGMSKNGSRANGAPGGSAATAARPDQGTQTLAGALGWGSLGLGVPMITAPGRFDRAIGVCDDREARAWTLAVGLREHAAAAGILALERPRPVHWLWARVAGDAMDLALLVSALRSKSERPARTVAAIGAVLGIGAADVIAATRMSRAPEPPGEDDPMQVRATITVRRPREEVYGFLRDLQNLPRFAERLESVRQIGDSRFQCKAAGPAGPALEWEAEIVEDRPGELIAWRSMPGAALENTGKIRLVDAPREQGTEIHLELEYTPPGGMLGDTVVKLFGETSKQFVKDDLRRYKQLAETGIIVRSEGGPEGPSTVRLLRQRPAQPPPAPVGTGGRS
jgi:uncharacterized membrane protein